MTDDQQKLFEKMIEQNQKVYDFWFKPPSTTQKCRSVQLDKILDLSRGTSLMGKALMMVFGLFVTIATAWQALKALMGV